MRLPTTTTRSAAATQYSRSCLPFGGGAISILALVNPNVGRVYVITRIKNMKTETPNETRYTHDFPSHYRKVIHELETEVAQLRASVGQIADTYLDDHDCPAAFRMRAIARGFFKNYNEEGQL